MNPPRTIEGNFPQVTRPGSFGIFDSIKGASDIANNISLQCHGVAVIENPGHDIILKTMGTIIFLKLKKMGKAILTLGFDRITLTGITPTQITPTRITST